VYLVGILVMIHAFTKHILRVTNSVRNCLLFPYAKIWLVINVELHSYKFSYRIVIHKVVPVHTTEIHVG
jgi:hypothetical protein